MDSIGIIGWGRFGRLLGEILKNDYELKVYDQNPSPSDEMSFVSWDEILREKTLFLCVPIRNFKGLVKNLASQLTGEVTVLDVCSVKVYPVTVMQDHLPESVGIIATHPLFGPDSWTAPAPHRLVMHSTRDRYSKFDIWEAYFTSKNMEVLEMSPEEHDRLAAKTQGLTHFVGRVLRNANVGATEIDTLGFTDLLQVVDQTCNDSWELFLDLQNFNPYTMEMIHTMESSIAHIRQRILDRN
ncbi:MAG: prephenate dehydrogenase/arogenate dehydrogenase family protein [FCB group bacterium]|nr:prephenate dehydrogenase/arogenate dehydrogenase family protein [FCB group bacterium]